jgi:hypothetical protein
MALILDVARFKYPPHWVSVPLLWDAMNEVWAFILKLSFISNFPQLFYYYFFCVTIYNLTITCPIPLCFFFVFFFLCGLFRSTRPATEVVDSLSCLHCHKERVCDARHVFAHGSIIPEVRIARVRVALDESIIAMRVNEMEWIGMVYPSFERVDWHNLRLTKHITYICVK